MSSPPPSQAHADQPDSGAPSAAAEALAQALRQLMEPLASLAIAKGLPYALVEDMLKTAFVDSARAAHPQLLPHRLVSRISTVTGINRREVTRLTQLPEEHTPVRHSPATRVFTKWMADPALKSARGEVLALPRQGPAPSFESLAHSITRDVHPRSLLDELCRLGLARVDTDTDTVHLAQDRVVPRGDMQRMLGFLGNNVGDHLRAAVANVLADTPPHLEQAIFADGLSAQSVDTLRQLMRTQWKTLLDGTVPELQRLIDEDRAAGRPQDQRVRIGLYTFNDMVPTQGPEAGTVPTPTKPRKAAPKPNAK